MANPKGEQPKSSLEVYEQDTNTRPSFLLSFAEIKLLGITGVSTARSLPLMMFLTHISRSTGWVLLGWFVSRLFIRYPFMQSTTAYDLFIINVSATLPQLRTILQS